MTAITCDIPVIIDGYESAKSRQRYLIEKMEALDMALWMARIPSATKFHYPRKLHRTDDDNMETEILDIMREIESLQGILDIYEDVDDAVEMEEEEEEEELELEEPQVEMFTRGRQSSLCVPIPSNSFSRHPSPCTKAVAQSHSPPPPYSDVDRSFNPFRDEFFLGLDEPVISEETEFLAVPGKKSRPISAISAVSTNSLFGDIVEYVRGWNPFELGSAGTSRRSSTASTPSLNEMISDTSTSSDESDSRSIRKTSQESQQSCATDITVPLILDHESLKGFSTRKSSFSSECPWRDYLEFEVDDEYDTCGDSVNEIITVQPSDICNLGRSFLNTTAHDISRQGILYSERELSMSSLTLSSTSEPHSVQIELPAYEEDNDEFHDAEDLEDLFENKLLGKFDSYPAKTIFYLDSDHSPTHQPYYFYSAHPCKSYRIYDLIHGPTFEL